MSLSKEAMLALLKNYEEAYYSGESKVTDEEYDALKSNYVELYGEYDFVPNEGDTELFKKTKHIHPLKSLDKIQITEEEKLRKELARLWPVIIQPKFDGLSIEIAPGIKFITRGDGEIGDDVSAQCNQINGVEFLENLPFINNHSYRAEILMTHNDFARLNKEKEQNGEELLSNCRNAASGMLRNKDLSKIDGLTIMLYEELGSTNTESYDINSLHDYLDEFIEDTNIEITPYFIPKDIDEAIRYLKELDSYRKLINYDIDGWVVKSNKPNSLELFGGYTGHHPKNAFAVKGEAKGAWTPIKSITWQVGKEYITPVAELEPIEIDGSIISRATLHNVSFLKAIGLTALEYKDKYGANPLTQVKVIKANDVIPRIIEIKSPDLTKYSKGYFCIINPPQKCPICGSSTAIKDTDSDSEILICTGNNCPAKLQKRIEQMCSRDGLNIAGMSEGTVKKFLDAFDIEHPISILNATKEDILDLEGFAEKSADNLYKAIQKAIKEQDVNKVLYASTIPLIGKSASKDICMYYSLNELMNMITNYSKEDFITAICKVKDIGRTMAESFYNNKDDFEALASCIDNIKDIKSDKKNPEKQLIICITGQREPFKTIIEETGHKVSSSVSKKTNALVNANNEQSSKALKAKELNIPIITTEQELRNFLSIDN